ncbi:hypothetical protein JZ751_029860 [Albula glossodonta]|uniref:Uncharacterized protein n=1 Tax=Albula glossodonta TaxID=121402 RepID=A0A8T2MVN9_9TELE|nr:hypothetical protein JZ751_029860 [Albula glossodonta]
MGNLAPCCKNKPSDKPPQSLDQKHGAPHGGATTVQLASRPVKIKPGGRWRPVHPASIIPTTDSEELADGSLGLAGGQGAGDTVQAQGVDIGCVEAKLVTGEPYWSLQMHSDAPSHCVCDAAEPTQATASAMQLNQPKPLCLRCSWTSQSHCVCDAAGPAQATAFAMQLNQPKPLRLRYSWTSPSHCGECVWPHCAAAFLRELSMES